MILEMVWLNKGLKETLVRNTLDRLSIIPLSLVLEAYISNKIAQRPEASTKVHIVPIICLSAQFLHWSLGAEIIIAMPVDNSCKLVLVKAAMR